MKLELKSFQSGAVEDVYTALVDARKRATKGRLEAVTLSAPTGSGKTVIVTRVVELILRGDEAHNPDPGATFLWLTDQPELNIQTRDKMAATSEILDYSATVEIGPEFDQETFSPGRVYFLNTQKLGTGTTWVKGGDDRTFTLWDTIRNTTDQRPGRFVVIIDEAHRGTKFDSAKSKEANSIMQKFVLGSDEIAPVPLVVGVSATLDRFSELLESAAKLKRARTHQRVDVDPADVIASGLLKRKVVLHHPKQSLGADFPLLRQALGAWRDMDQRWQQYCESQGIPAVKPILVVQVEDGTKAKTSVTDLDQVLSVIRDEAGDLSDWAFAHAFESGTSVVLGDGTTLRYLAPSKIDMDNQVRVVLFKTSLNTGWDCPRAEVMMSFRTAKDATYIAQLVGRMVRTPLAREITQDDVLNSVALMLPRFDSKELSKVVERLTDISGDVPPTVVEEAQDRVVLVRAVGCDDCCSVLEGLPTYIVPTKRSVNEILRVGQLADALTQTGLRPKAGNEARDALAGVLEGQYADRKDTPQYRDVVKEDGTIPVVQVALDYGITGSEESTTQEVGVSDEMVARLYEWARKRLGLDLGIRYWKRRAADDTSENHLLTKLELYALAADAEVLNQLREAASELTAKWLAAYKAAIKKLPETDRKRFDDVKAQSSKPTRDDLDVCSRTTIDWSIPKGATPWPQHLFRDSQGQLPDKLNTWEASTLMEEMGKDGFVAWLRNKESKPWSLCVPYLMNGVWKRCYPDFLVCRRVGKHTVVDIVDPHLTTIEDAPAKAAGLAAFADEHQDAFGRIDLVIVDKQGTADQRVLRLPLLNDAVRKKVLAVQTAQHLRDLFEYEA